MLDISSKKIWKLFKEIKLGSQASKTLEKIYIYYILA